MNQGHWRYSGRHRESLVSAISAGFFFILAGTIFITTPNLIDGITEFFRDFTTIQIPRIEGIYLPAPDHPATHLTVYSAVGQFSLIWGIFLIAIMGLRFAAHSPLNKKADNAGDIVFWLGAYYLLTTILNEATTHATWFAFWAEMIMLGGVSLIVRAIVLATARLKT